MSITEAAEESFAREGYAATSIDGIAARACVSRQTIYNHYGDKEQLFLAVVRDLTERSNAGLYQLIASFPDRPIDLEAELADFALRLIRNCLCNRDGKALRRLIEAEGERYPELFATWRQDGPGKAWALIGARLAGLDHAGLLRIDDPERAARQFMALIYADIQMITLFGGAPTEAEMHAAARTGVRTFLAAFGTAAGPRRDDSASVQSAMLAQ
ncbi:TetR/AcrR family transcriptional regulator [Kaistia algarum]|uniref:TetR/AcrR family transcriptional regulator n=1 Tax=Kaistia algarum TaxID=2083279 RepID=UPI003898EDC9